MFRHLCLITLGVAASIHPLAADEILFTDGRTLEGEIIATEANGDLKLAIGYGEPVAIRYVKHGEVQEIRRGPTERQKRLQVLLAERDALATQATATGEQFWKLAERARILDEGSLRRELAKAAIDHDPDHAEAREYLGFVQQDGTWMTRIEAAKARGEVFFRNRWMTAAQRDALVAADEAKRVAAAKAQEDAAIAYQRGLEQRKQAAEVRTKEAEARAKEAEAAKKEADARAAERRARGIGTRVDVGVFEVLPPWYGSAYYHQPPIVILPPACPPRRHGQTNGLTIEADGRIGGTDVSVSINGQ